MNTSNETWDALWTLTMRAHKKRITDTIFDEYPGLGWFNKNALETEVGGKEIQEDIEYAKQNVEWFRRHQVLNTEFNDHVTAVFYPWRYVAVPILIAIDEENESRMAASAMKLLESRSSNAMKSIRDGVSTALFSAQTGLTMLGLQDIIAADPTTGSLGGLTRVGNTFWQNKYYSSAVDMDSATGGIFAGPQRLNLLYNESASGNDAVQQVWMDETRFGDYQNIYTSANFARTTLSGGGAQAPKAPPINNAKIDFDRDMPSGFIYGVNKNYVKLKIQKGLNFAKTPFRSPHNQLTKVAFIVVSLQLVTNNPRRNFVMSNVT